jgi:hypothetical protein
MKAHGLASYVAGGDSTDPCPHIQQHASMPMQHAEAGRTAAASKAYGFCEDACAMPLAHRMTGVLRSEPLPMRGQLTSTGRGLT